MLEVLLDRSKGLTLEEIRGLKEEAKQIFSEVLGTPKERVRVFLVYVNSDVDAETEHNDGRTSSSIG